MRNITWIAMIASCMVAQMCAAAEPLSIRNDSLEVRCDPSNGRFSISAIGEERPFISTGVLSAGGGTGRMAVVDDKVFGGGQSVEIARANGSADRIILYNKLPFALLRSTLHNDTAHPVTINKLKTAEFTLDLGTPASALKMLGTGGLASLDRRSGSYMWLAVADPKSRRGVVGGWITTDRGSGVVFGDSAEDRARVTAQVEFGRLRLAPGATAESEMFAVGLFADARLGMEAWADAVAKVYDIHLPPQPVGYCTWYHAGSWNEKALAAQAEFAGKSLKPFGFSVMQIDDGWQDGQTKNGPRKNFTQIRPRGPYASGMKATADHIRAQGLVPGIWFMPFSGSHEDPWYKDHQDWFVKHDDGTPHESRWGGTALDMTDPGAREYLRSSVKRIVDEWGYRYLKMDGLCSGLGVQHVYVNDSYKEDGFGDGVFHNPDKTNVEAFRDGLKLIREAAGRKTYILGCTVAQNMRAYGGAFGLVDAMRVGPDNNWQWRSLVTGPKYGTRNYHLNGRIWHNDPDCVYVRPQMPLNHARLIASWSALSGQLSISSEDFAKLPPERLDILKRTMPAHGRVARPVDLFDSAMPRVWLVTDARGPRRDVVGLFNWADSEAAFDYPVEWIGLPKAREYVAFDYWNNKLVGPFNGRLRYSVPGQSCAVLAVRAAADHPQVISTSRHITQGMVDLLEEKWSGRELSGVSKVVGDDPYELRIVVPSGGQNAPTVDVSDEDRAAGVKALVKTEAGLVRVTIESAQSRDVRWKVSF